MTGRGLFSWSQRAGLARLLILALFTSWAGPLFHHAGGHDADCDPALILHDESKHRWAAAPTAADDEELPGDHCVGCHFSRSMRGAVSLHRTGVVNTPVTRPTLEPVGRVAGDPRNRPLPARAPPASA